MRFLTFRDKLKTVCKFTKTGLIKSKGTNCRSNTGNSCNTLTGSFKILSSDGEASF